MTVSQGLLPFKVELTETPEPVTAWAGLPLIVEAMRALFSRRYYRKLRRALGYKSWKVARRHLESLVVLIAGGGDHLSDLEVLRADAGLAELLGFELSSPTQAKDFLYRFHQTKDGQPLSDEEDAALTVVGTAQIRPEGPGLRVLRDFVDGVVRVVQTVHLRRRATIDSDATLIEAHKVEALRTYKGFRGYQPQMSWWAEQEVWILDEFRDGNVPAEFEAKRYLQRTFGAISGTAEERRFRGDAAFYNEAALTWADDEGDVDFAVSADMSPELTKVVKAIAEPLWQPYRNLKDTPDPIEERQWAEVINFVPDWKRNNIPGKVPFRYIAIRVRSRQRDLLKPDEDRWRHFAVVSNMDWQGERLLRWQREKQGTVEFAHGVMKNDLAGGVMPCGRFGANAAWWRINALTHNLLTLVKLEALPEAVHNARPKTLRFRLFNLAGRLIHHAGSLILKLSAGFPLAEAYVQARARLRVLAYLPGLAFGPAP